MTFQAYTLTSMTSDIFICMTLLNANYFINFTLYSYFLFRTSLCYKSLSLGVIFPSCSIKYNYKASASYSDYDHFTGTGFIFYNHFNSGYTNVIIKFQTFTNIFLACSKDFIILIIQGISSIIDDT